MCFCSLSLSHIFKYLDFAYKGYLTRYSEELGRSSKCLFCCFNLSCMATTYSISTACIKMWFQSVFLNITALQTWKSILSNQPYMFNVRWITETVLLCFEWVFLCSDLFLTWTRQLGGLHHPHTLLISFFFGSNVFFINIFVFFFLIYFVLLFNTAVVNANFGSLDTSLC